MKNSGNLLGKKKEIQKCCGYWHLDYFGIYDSVTLDSLDSIYLIEYSKSCLGTQ